MQMEFQLSQKQQAEKELAPSASYHLTLQIELRQDPPHLGHLGNLTEE